MENTCIKKSFIVSLYEKTRCFYLYVKKIFFSLYEKTRCFYLYVKKIFLFYTKKHDAFTSMSKRSFFFIRCFLIDPRDFEKVFYIFIFEKKFYFSNFSIIEKKTSCFSNIAFLDYKEFTNIFCK